MLACLTALQGAAVLLVNLASRSVAPPTGLLCHTACNRWHTKLQ